MNKIILKADLTEKQKEQVILEFSKTWKNVESINCQTCKDGTITNYNINYVCDEKGRSGTIKEVNLIFN
ncbi:hypothetical protein LOOC260_113030 [Paucilactobacillus hokkaidonensis JCM 18461]|uniref:Uncharacterized protein n=1 Tax=Paucilactobacillus hokkaidonensis JCM 18461 TaxID=1291742 RepID=A0A0A1GY63_9LACO|nr:hypothetical protein [Paucilactobacillus hokkaidonensis]BAP85839.1 hypothetical protein LOOC260_113030 [Paucilactobacillus hokkaidonensis JCM 18461]